MKELFENDYEYLFTNKDKDILLFMDSAGNCKLYICSGDCCSTSWIENIENLDALLGHKIIGIEIKEYPDINPVEGYDFITRYGYTLKTKQGHCDIEFRNGSNGYYGGSLDYQDENEYVLYSHPTENKEFKVYYSIKQEPELYISLHKQERQKLHLWKN